MTPGELVIAIGHQNQSRNLIDPPSQQSHYIQRCLVRPMDVLDDENRRFPPAQLVDNRDGHLARHPPASNYLFELAADRRSYVEQGTQRMRCEKRIAGAGYYPDVSLVASEATDQHCLADSSLTGHQHQASSGCGIDCAEVFSERREVFGSFQQVAAAGRGTRSLAHDSLLDSLGRTCSSKSTHVKLLHAVLNSSTGLSLQHFKNGLCRRAENLDARGGVQRFSISLGGALLNHTHVELKRIRIGMDLHDCHLRPFVVCVLVERDQTWFVGFDEIDQPGHPPALGLALSRLESVGRDEDEWSRHRFPPYQACLTFACAVVANIPMAVRRLSQGGNGDAAICGFRASSSTVRWVSRSRIVDRARDAGDSRRGDHHRLD